MPLSKKDYEAIASIIRFTTITVIPLSESGHKKVVPRNDLVNELCTYFKRENSRFDTDRFKEAVEPKYRKTLLEVFSEDEPDERIVNSTRDTFEGMELVTVRRGNKWYTEWQRKGEANDNP